ncbi:outer membrane beta-barrel protein [Tannerella sp.]|uniref:outer membrane beta-barrel protein n=1 Tax=Tannerella sp. TaxID=2382127 RepID=UPI0026DAC2FA|nr:outer membrane beta-barrel family protein [Tannerella sp.]MDO4704241.1 outer membrane beta-barrel family protein [Tannerella sp.]
MRTFQSMLIFLLGGIVYPLSAQITGRVVDTRNQPLEFANVALYALPDTTLITGTITDTEGKFAISSAHTGQSMLRISMLGYETKEIDPSRGEPGIIVLNAIAQQLEDVIVTARRIKRSPGGYAVNLQGEETAQGKQADELLPFLPGITTENGLLKVLGQNIGVIYLDGIRIKDQKELAAIPAEQIQTVKVDYLAGSEEFASIKGAVIRIQLKKQPQGGYYGRLSAGATFMSQYGFTGDYLTSTYSYRYKKLSLYNSLYYNDSKAIGDIENQTLFRQSGTKINTVEQYRSWGRYVHDRLSLTYDLTENQTLGASFFLSTHHAKPNNDVRSETTTTEGKTLSRSTVETPYDYLRYQATARYNYVTDENGSELAVVADYLQNNEEDRMKTRIFGKEYVAGVTESRSRQITRMMETQISYDKHFASGNALNTGVSHRLIRTDYDLRDFRNITEKPEARGQMPAIFSEFKGQINNFQYGIGLRLQQSLIEYHPSDRTASSKYSDWDIYPSADLLYMINPDKGHLFMLSYKRSVDEMPYSAISPYRKYESEHSYIRGNPELIAPKQSLVMAGLELFDKVSISGIYMYGQNPIYHSTQVDPENPQLTYMMPKNGHHETLLGINLETRLQPTSWWGLKANAMYSLYGSETEDFKVSNQSKYYFSMNNNFTFSKNAGATLEGYYEPTYMFTNERYRTVYEMSGSVYKKFFNGKLECRLKCKLFRKGRVIETDTPKLWKSYANQTNEQYLQISLSYSSRGGKKVSIKQTESLQEYNKIESSKR